MGTADMMTVGSMSVSQYTANMQILAKSISHNRMNLQQGRKAATEKERYIYPSNATLLDLGPDRSCIF